jgi:hypothetical protein
VISDGINSLQITRFTQEFQKIPERTWILLTSYNFSINRPKHKISIAKRNPVDPNLIDMSFSEFQTKNIDPDMPIPDDSDCVNLTDLLNIRTLLKKITEMTPHDSFCPKKPNNLANIEDSDDVLLGKRNFPDESMAGQSVSMDPVKVAHLENDSTRKSFENQKRPKVQEPMNDYDAHGLVFDDEISLGSL